MSNFLKVELAPDGTIHVSPKEPFTSANFTEQQACDLIAALRGALDHLRRAEFVRTISIDTWYAVAH